MRLHFAYIFHIIILNVIKLSVTYKPFILSAIMLGATYEPFLLLNVIMLSVIMLNVVAPLHVVLNFIALSWTS
jgi:hypothetical protein